jgi:hypothetical protein
MTTTLKDRTGICTKAIDREDSWGVSNARAPHAASTSNKNASREISRVRFLALGSEPIERRAQLLSQGSIHRGSDTCVVLLAEQAQNCLVVA